MFYVYAIGPIGGYPIKIGVAEKPAKRLLILQTSCWEELAIHGIYKANNRGDAYRFERLAHKRLADKRMRGEWFNVFASDAIDILDELSQETIYALKLLRK